MFLFELARPRRTPVAGESAMSKKPDRALNFQLPPMTTEERDLITGLFSRLRNAEPPQRDSDADHLIQQSVSAQPGAPYLLVQTLLVQEHALLNAQTRIKALEQQVAAAKAQPAAHSGGFLSGLFGGGTAAGTANIPPQSLPAAPSAPYPSTVNPARERGRRLPAIRAFDRGRRRGRCRAF